MQIDFLSDNAVVPLMSESEARTCVEDIRNGIVHIGRKLLELYEREGWRALGYVNWRECAQAEFGFKQSHVYRLLSAAQVERNISPMGENEVVPERHLRELSRVEPERQTEVLQRAAATAPNGKPTAQHIRNVVDEVAPPLHDEYDAKASEYAESQDGYDWTEEPEPESAKPDSDEWYTPSEFIALVRAVLGSIDLDPASCDDAQERIQAKQYFTKDDDGLAQPWRNRVWLNPPYGSPLAWVEKLLDSFEAGSVTAALLLVNTANSPQWSRRLWESRYTVCLLSRRIHFWRPDIPDAKRTMQDQMVWYLGDDVRRFRAVFAQYGAFR